MHESVEYGSENCDEIERMSQLRPQDEDSDELEATAALQKSVLSQGDFEDDGPVGDYVTTVKGTLNAMKTGLDAHTNVENMVSCVTSKYLQKFAINDSKSIADQAMNDFMERHANFDVQSSLSKMQH